MLLGVGGGVGSSAEDKDEVVAGGWDASGELGGGTSSSVILFFEKLLGARGGIGERIKGILAVGDAGGGISDIDIGITIGLEGRLLGSSDTWGISTVDNYDGRIFIFAGVTREHFGNIFLDVGVVASAADRENIRNTIDSASSHVIFGLDKGNLTDGVKVKVGSEVGKCFEFINRKAGAEIIAESVDEAKEVGNREGFLENAVLDADEDFLLRGAAGEITTSGAMTGTGEAKCLTTVNGIRDASLKYGASIEAVVDILV